MKRLFWCAALAILGCADDKSPSGSATPDAGATSPTVKDAGSETESAAQEFLNAYAASVCALYKPCCEAEAFGFDADGCRVWFRKVTAAFFSGAFQPDAARDCLRDLASARDADADRCKNVLSFDDATLRETCRQAFGTTYSGGAALGGSCLLGGDCSFDPEGPVICYGGQCVVDKRGTEGEGPCYVGGRSGDDQPLTKVVRCEARDGLYCHRAERVCKAQLEPGEYCPYLNACRDGATCSGGRCVTLPGPDEPCVNAVRGAGGTCRPGSACDKDTLICGAALTEGQACREPAQCASRACSGGKCGKPEFTRALNCTGNADQ